jgi:hypothetical protein
MSLKRIVAAHRDEDSMDETVPHDFQSDMDAINEIAPIPSIL